MKYSCNRKLLCEFSKLSKLNAFNLDTKRLTKTKIDKNNSYLYDNVILVRRVIKLMFSLSSRLSLSRYKVVQSFSDGQNTI